jgi:hypothetical protein
MPSESLQFAPWRGSDYEPSEWGVKILILGESTYLIPKRGLKSMGHFREEPTLLHLFDS